MRKISYRFVYNRKKSLNDRGTALVQVEAYLNIMTECLRYAENMMLQ